MLTKQKQSALGRGKRFNSNDDEALGGREDGAKSRSGGGARNVFILIMVSKILAAAAPPLPASASGESVLDDGRRGLSSQYSLVHNSISFTRHQFVSSKL